MLYNYGGPNYLSVVAAILKLNYFFCILIANLMSLIKEPVEVGSLRTFLVDLDLGLMDSVVENDALVRQSAEVRRAVEKVAHSQVQ